jgi:ADP-ribose pyrophosphatase
MKYHIIDSEPIFEGKVFNVRVDKVQKPSGQITRVDVVEHSGAVVLVPIDAQGNFHFVNQYRYPIEQRLLELPAGTLDPNEEPETCARRECREEIRMSPGRLIDLGSFYLAPGYSTEFLHIYLAQDLSASSLERDEDEDIKIEMLAIEEIRQAIKQGIIKDAKTLASLLLAFQHLGITL